MRFGLVFAVAEAFFALCLAGRTALAADFGSIEVSVQPQPVVEGNPPSNHWGGYVEHRIVVRNHSKTVDHKVRLVQPARSFGGYDDQYLERNERAVEVPHGATMVVSLFQPSIPVFDENMAVEIDGVRQKNVVELPSPLGRGAGAVYGAYGGRGGYRPAATPTLVVLTSRKIEQNLRDKVHAAHGDDIVFCRSETETSEWSPNWLGYTAYDVILLTRHEIGSLPAEVLLALRRYVEAGGIILVRGSGSNADPGKLVPEGLRDADSQADREGTFRVGFGMIRPCPKSAPWPGELWRAEVKEPFAPMDADIQIFNRVTVPVRGLLLVVICFAVGIGPFNVWLLSRKQKKMWLWWNVPLVSLLTCMTVFGYAVVSEGFSGRGRTTLLTLLDENTHLATTLGYVSYYCPLTPSDGLHFSYDTEVVQLRSRSSGTGSRPKTIDWTSDQHLDSGWVAARVPACFAIRRSETRRERLAMHKGADGVIKVVNGLGMPISALVYADDDGSLYIANDLPPGQERTLEKSGKKVSDEAPPAGIASPDSSESSAAPVPTISTEEEEEVEDADAGNAFVPPGSPGVPPPAMPPGVYLATGSVVVPNSAAWLTTATPEIPGSLRSLFEQGWATSLHELQVSPGKYLKPGCYIAIVGQSHFLEDPLPAAPQEGSFGVIYGIGAKAGDGR